MNEKTERKHELERGRHWQKRMALPPIAREVKAMLAELQSRISTLIGEGKRDEAKAECRRYDVAAGHVIDHEWGSAKIVLTAKVPPPPTTETRSAKILKIDDLVKKRKKERP